MLYNGCEGIGSARNLGLQAAKGEYILFLDSDDYLPDELVFDRYVNIAEQTDTDILVSNYVRLWKARILPAATHRTFSRYSRCRLSGTPQRLVSVPSDQPAAETVPGPSL